MSASREMKHLDADLGSACGPNYIHINTFVTGIHFLVTKCDKESFLVYVHLFILRGDCSISVTLSSVV